MIKSHFAPLPFKSRYLSHLSLEWSEIWHDDSLDGIDRAKSQKKFKLRLAASIAYYVSQSVFPIYLSHFSSEWTEIWRDDSLDVIDRAKKYLSSNQKHL